MIKIPYHKYTIIVKGKKKFCIKNKETGKVTCYDSEKKRETGIRMKHIFRAGWKSTRLKK